MENIIPRILFKSAYKPAFQGVFPIPRDLQILGIIEDIASLRIAEGGETTVVVAGLGIAKAAFLASLAGGTGAHSGRFRTGRHLVVAVAMRAGLDQLAVCGDGDAVLWGIFGESAGGRDQAISNEGDHQAILTGTKLIQGST